MFSPELNQLIIHEKFKDHLRNREKQQLIAIARLQRPGRMKLYRKIVTWFGGQMVKWGTRLQHYDAPAPSKVTTIKAR